MNNYHHDIDFLEGLSNIPRQNYMLGLQDRRHFIIRLRNFLSLLGSPEKNLKFIHIAGTSGKGTTVKLLEIMIADAGFRTGSFTSPFATTSIEKISINNRLISPRELHQILENRIKPALDKYLIKFKTDQVSYFEVWLAIALIYFTEKKCDWVILEAGLGGTHDATNVIVAPKVTAITNVGMDHTDILGNSKEKIAKDKAGIIKRNSIFLTTEKNKKLLKIFKTVCRRQQAWLINLQPLAKNYQVSDYFSTKKQQDNLNLVLNILSVLKIKPCHSQKIIDNFRLICRQERIQIKPLIILDGSHNADKLNNLLDFIKSRHYNKLHLVLGFAQNKNYKRPLTKLLSISHSLYLTRFIIRERKSADLRKLQQIAKQIGPNIPITIHHDPYQALDAAQQKANKNDLILITGSFFLAGELRKKWVSEEYIIENLKLDKK